MFRLLLVLVAVMFFVAGTAEAQVKPGDSVIFLNLGGASAKLAGPQDAPTVNGNNVSFSYEKLAYDKPVSFLLAIGYTRFEDELKDDTSDTLLVHRQLSSLPIYVGAKGWLGKGRVQGFAGVTLALSFTEMVTTFNDNAQTSVGTSGFGLGIPIGGSLNLGEKFLIDAQYTLNWVWSNEAFQDDIVHAYSAGLGLRFD